MVVVSLSVFLFWVFYTYENQMSNQGSGGEENHPSLEYTGRDFHKYSNTNVCVCVPLKKTIIVKLEYANCQAALTELSFSPTAQTLYRVLKATYHEGAILPLISPSSV